MRKINFQPDYTSGLTALFSVIFWLSSVFTGFGLRFLFPHFDGLPLLALLLGALAVACITNRIAAKIFARNHFGMPPEERRDMYARHTEECKRDPDAVLARYEDMGSVPLFLLGVYFILVFAIGAAAPLCVYEHGDLPHTVGACAGILLAGFLGFMPIYRIVEQFSMRLNRTFLVPEGELPQLETLAKQAADTVGVKGSIRLEITRDCDCDVNRVGRTYVVFLGTRLLTALTKEELFQCLLLSFDYFSRLKEYRRILRRYRLGSLGAADIRPLTFAFDLFFSYADATMEWEYDLYAIAFKLRADRLANERIRREGNPSATVSGMCKRALWRYFVFEANDFIAVPFYKYPEPHWHYEWDVCDAYRRALAERREVWLDMLSREMRPEGERHRPLFREQWRALTPEATAPVIDIWVPDLTTPYGEEVMKAVELVENRIREEITRSYTAARKREYLEPLATVEAYEASPEGYTTPELSPIINAYRDICQYDKAEALCDGILETETNPFALAHAIYFKGMCMLHRYETEGIDLIYRAIDLNKNYMKDGFEMVEEYCTLCGLSDEYEGYLHRADIQVSAHAYNHEGAGSLSATDHLVREEGLGGMLPDILSYMEQVSEGCIREIYLVRKVISEDFFTSVFVLNFAYGASDDKMRHAYEAIFNYLDTYPVDWQFSLFVYDRETERAVKRIEGSLVWESKDM